MSTDQPMLGRRTYLDANLYIYAFEGIETYRTRMAGLLGVCAVENIAAAQRACTLPETGFSV